ncbi:hypothetical protein IE81DRAFT_340698 [Ceraceosorus guamensis]|uniref:Uncharacterized protein n=1 Tax=Ceraceosorus guamensis TaxID=1522189 RepID=A0A316W0X2_9BASI|nr:hypothetical protein IE81DRAFT_340698 [Ceraceosorus guamensis]PWN43496.1 hypothetical protein IE81DRAFT_340698 [Ceraceosorus guamensis]
MLLSLQRALLCGWMAVALDAALVAAVVLPQHGSMDLFPRSPLLGGWLKKATGSGSASASSSAGKTFYNPAHDAAHVSRWYTDVGMLKWEQDRDKGFTRVNGHPSKPPDTSFWTRQKAKSDMKSLHMYKKHPSESSAYAFNKHTGKWTTTSGWQDGVPDLFSKSVMMDHQPPSASSDFR